MAKLTVKAICARRTALRDAAKAFGSLATYLENDSNPGGADALARLDQALSDAAIRYVAAIATNDDGKRFYRPHAKQWLEFIRKNSTAIAAGFEELRREQNKAARRG